MPSGARNGPRRRRASPVISYWLKSMQELPRELRAVHSPSTMKEWLAAWMNVA